MGNKILQYLKYLRRERNQKMKLGRLMEYIMRNIFLKKPYIKCCGETEHISGSTV